MSALPDRPRMNRRAPNGAEPMADILDGEPWSEMDLAHLRTSLGSGDTIEGVARFLFRSGTIEEVCRKAEELGLSYKSRDPLGEKSQP